MGAECVTGFVMVGLWDEEVLGEGNVRMWVCVAAHVTETVLTCEVVTTWLTDAVLAAEVDALASAVADRWY